MAHPFEHAESSAKKFGGRAEDYLAIHNWLDESKAFFPISDIAHFATMPKASSYASASSASRLPTAKAHRFRYDTSENSTCARILDGSLPPKTGCHKSSPPAGCTVSVSIRTIQSSIPNET